MFQIFIEELSAWIDWFMQGFPGRAGRLIRRIYFRTKLRESGWVLSIGMNVEIACPQNISLGNETYLNPGVILRACGEGSLSIGDCFQANGNVRVIADCGGQIIIGNNVMIGPNTVIRSANHSYNQIDLPIAKQGHKAGQIFIGDDVWIAANVVILPDVKIGSHSIIAAGAVVTRDVPEYAIVAGVPAKIISSRLAES